MRVGALCCVLVASVHASAWTQMTDSLTSLSPWTSLLEAGYTCKAPTPENQDLAFGWCKEGKESFDPLQKCHPVCKAGYFPTETELTCQESGFFSPPSFTCVGTLESGQMCEENFGEDGMPSGTTCTVKCKPGYGPYPHNVTCSNTKLSAPNKCIRIDGACAVPGVFTDNVIGDPLGKPCAPGQRLDLYATCDVKCADGWRSTSTSHSSKYDCVADTVPSPVAPTLTCEGVECNLPPLGANVAPAMTGGCNGQIGHGQSCGVRCETGYQMKDPTASTKYSCHASQLTQASIECVVKNCGTPSLDLVGNNLGTGFSEGCMTTYQSTCDAVCAPGYRGDSKTWTCNQEANWIGTIPDCQPIYCPTLPFVPMMQPDPAGCNTFFPSTCKYYPGPGYLGSIVTQSCGTDGQWHPDRDVDATAILCDVNEHVVDHKCVPCPAGQSKVAGSSAAGADNECLPCPLDTYRSASMEQCSACPLHSTTDGVVGAAEKADCKCSMGYTGTITENSPADVCVACGPNTFKSHAGSAQCQVCPGTSVTDEAIGVTSVSGCKCAPGTYGDLAKDEACTDCPADTFKSTIGTAACTSCPVESTTGGGVGKSDPEDCLCEFGHTGLVLSTTSVCKACPKNRFKPSLGSSACTLCPPNSHTETEGVTKVDACKCNEGFSGVIISTANSCDAITCDGSELSRRSLGTGQKHSEQGNTKIAYNVSVTVSCDEGYHPAGVTGPFTCKGLGSDGFGNPDTSGLSCDRIQCDPSTIHLGTGQRMVTTDTVDYLGSAIVECKEGFLHNVPRIALTCDGSDTNNNNWKDPSTKGLVCTAITCDGADLELASTQESPASANANLPYNYMAEVKCKDGHISAGSTGPFKCDAEGYGDKDTSGLSCTPVTCRTAALELQEHQMFSLSAGVVGYNDAGQIKCATGYRPVGDVTQLQVACNIISARGWSEVNSADLKCEVITCDSSKLSLGPHQTTTMFGDTEVDFNHVGKAICKSGYKAKIGTGLTTEVTVQCTGAGTGGFGDPTFGSLVCEDQDDCTEELKWSKTLPEAASQIRTAAGCTDGYARSRFNDPVSFCAWFCKIEETCLDFFVYGQDTTHPHRCCTFSDFVQPAATDVKELSGEFYAQTCPDKQQKTTQTNGEQQEGGQQAPTKWWNAPENLPPASCPAGRYGAKTIGNDCFWMPDGQKTFADAEADCVLKGGHLASVHSSGEQTAVAELQTGCGNCRSYIGLRRPEAGSTEWSWTDGSPIDYMFDGWKAEASRDCISNQETVIGVHTNAAKWCGLGNGDSAQYYVCQKRPTPTPTPIPVPTPLPTPPPTTASLTTKNGKPTKDPGCTEQQIQQGKMASVVTGSITGCTNAFEVTKDFTDPKEHCAYLCSLDKSCNYFFVFGQNYEFSGRCCLQDSYNEAKGFYEVDGDFYSQKCDKQKPEPDANVYQKYLFLASDDTKTPARAVVMMDEATGEEPTVSLETFSTTQGAHYFRLVPAVNGEAGYISFMSAKDANKYLRHDGTLLHAQDYGSGDTFLADASFLMDAPLSPTQDSQFSFRSFSKSAAFVYHDGTTIKVGPIPTGVSGEAINAFKRSATFTLDPHLEKSFDFQTRGTRACRNWDLFDNIKGELTLPECRAACSAGVSGCHDECADNYHGGGKNECNALEFNEDTKTCTIFHKCVISSGEANGPIKLEQATYALPEPQARACTVCTDEEIMEKECTANHDRKCVCKAGYAGLPGACKRVECPANSSPNSNLTQCACDTGFSGGPFAWRTTTYQAGSCVEVACPAYAQQKENDPSLCQCAEGYLSASEDNTFKWDAGKQNFGTGECSLATCPTNSAGETCRCMDGFLSNVPEAGQAGVFANAGWKHTCEEVTCPTDSERLTTNGLDSCSCKAGYHGLVSWVKDKGWSGSCSKATCPEDYTEISAGVCKCPAGSTGIRKWSKTNQGFVPETCTDIPCPVGSRSDGNGGCQCDSLGSCSWDTDHDMFVCSCRTSQCPVANSIMLEGATLCSCKPGFSGTLSYNTNDDQYTGECKVVHCTENAIKHPNCECSEGYAPSVTGGRIEWDIQNQNYGTITCKKVECPQNSDTALHPACPCQSGYRLHNAAARNWIANSNSWSGNCEAIPCLPNSGSSPPNCACTAGFRPNNIQLEGIEYTGSCDRIACPHGGESPNCECPTGLTGEVTWDTKVHEWVSKCRPVACAAPAVGTPGSGKCDCPVGSTGSCGWSVSQGSWSCACEVKGCPEHSSIPAGESTCQCTHYGSLSWNSYTKAYIGGCSLMPWDHTNTQPGCDLEGTGHVSTDMVQQGSILFDLHGREEWVVLAGPYAPVEQPHLQVQVTTAPWKQTHINDVCTQEETPVVVYKDVALKCGKFDVLFVSTPHIMNDGKSGCNHETVQPKLLVRGTTTGGEYDAVDLLPSLDAKDEIQFEGGALFMSRNDCKNGCSNENIDGILRVVEFGLFCGETNTDRDTEVRVEYECASSGGCYSKVSVQVPTFTSVAKLRDGTTAGGVCGGWESTIEEELHTRHADCQKMNPDSFLSNLVCRNRFTTQEHNSLFRSWEEWTMVRSFKYDAVKWENGVMGVNPDNGEPEHKKDQARIDTMKAKCIALRKTVDTRAESALDQNVPVDAMLINVASVCAEDLYWSIDWDERIMAQHFCTALSKKIALERSDVYCASARLGLETEITDSVVQALRKACPTCTPARTEGVIMAKELSEIKNLVEEVKSSTEAIIKMTYPACAPYVDATSMAGLDCNSHRFRDTGSWSCGEPIPPPQAQFVSCESHNTGDTCTASCKAAYTKAEGDGSVTCKKVQGNGLEGVDVSMAWSMPTLMCKACRICASNEKESVTCDATTNTECVCKEGYRSHKGICFACEGGKYTDQSNQTECKTCPENSYNMDVGNDGCITCTTCAESEVSDRVCSATNDRTCKCKQGWAGPPGECTLCNGGKFSDEDGLTDCKDCSVCVKEEGEVALRSCSSGADTVCQCHAGFAGSAKKCESCLRGLTYTAVDGAKHCELCMVCNSLTETTARPCEVDANTVCQCKDSRARDGETCKEMHLRLMD